TQTWDPKAYGRDGAFVHELAGGVLEWLAARGGERILDLGCGDGQLTARIGASRGPDAAFDAVFSNAALHWVRDQDAMMAEVRRVLKPGGRFVAEMGGHGNIAAIRVGLMAVLARHGHADAEEGVNYYPTPEAYGKRLSRHGLNVEQIAMIKGPKLMTE